MKISRHQPDTYLFCVADPFNEKAETELQHVLNLLELPKSVTLETAIGGGARSAAGLSAGQRQLLSVARVLMRNVKICVLDEPTSNIDALTDVRIQTLLRDRLVGATVLTIAHRLYTIANHDRIAVMDSGTLAQIGTPLDLLADQKGKFYQMASELGAVELATLRATAAKGPLLCVASK